ncbi:hypothetical protein INT45_012499 [Circinella minor]|uniref:NAB co-repressor domain-containing protein n=1 Tax=Circinella minor TaxID=1195481 RepID=A0A8H7RW52_9FUNG|nr:hypothetical protein INT45_012499 [Circinella minor]
MQYSLHDFLSNNNLEHYYEAFVKSGATDQDLLQLLNFNDEELNDVLQAVNMLPFHAIKFKRGLRELRVQTNFNVYSNDSTMTATEGSSSTSSCITAAVETPRSPLPLRPGLDHILNTPDQHNTVSNELMIDLLLKLLIEKDDDADYLKNIQCPSSSSSSPLSQQQQHFTTYSDNCYQQQQALSPPEQTSREVIISHATIYGKNSSRPLTSYESSINEAAIQLALDNPSLLVNKGNLFELAKKKLLDSGYQYKRGKSRSKLTKGRAPTTTPEQQKEQKNARRSQLHAKRKLNAQRMSYERQQKMEELRFQLQNVIERQRHYPKEFSALEEKRTALNKEISKIKAKERKHQWYERRKMDRFDGEFSNTTEEEEDEQQHQQGNDDDTRSIASLSSAGSSSVTSSCSTASSSSSGAITTTSTLAHHHSPPIQPSSVSTAVSMGPMTLSRESDVRAKTFHEPTIARSELFSSV